MWLYILSSEIFEVLQNLKVLNISRNNINAIDLSFLLSDYITNLRSLDLKENDINFGESVSKLSVRQSMLYIGSDDWRFCCLSNILSTCDAPQGRQSDCLYLIRNLHMRGYVWFIAITGICFNMFVISYQSMLLKKQKRVDNLVLLNLAVADTVAAIFMLGLGTADFLMQGFYVRMDHWWRQSSLCLMLGFVQNLSMEASLFNVIQMSVVYVWVIKKGKIPLRFGLAMTLCVWTFVVSFSSLPLLVTKEMETGMCIFQLYSWNKPGLLAFGIVEHIVINGSLLVLSMFLTWVAISTIHASAKRVKLHGTVQSRRDKQKKFILCLYFRWDYGL